MGLNIFKVHTFCLELFQSTLCLVLHCSLVKVKCTFTSFINMTFYKKQAAPFNVDMYPLWTRKEKKHEFPFKLSLSKVVWGSKNFMSVMQAFIRKKHIKVITYHTLPTAEILSGKNARAWVSMVLYLENKLKLKH